VPPGAVPLQARPGPGGQPGPFSPAKRSVTDDARLGLWKCWTTGKNARKLHPAIVKASFDHLISVPAKTIIGPRL